MRYLTIQAPGRPVDGDTRLPFDPADPEAFLARPQGSNFGDYVVIDSMLRLVDGELVGNLQFGAPAIRAIPDCDHVVLRGSNYIRPNLDLTPLGDLIERLGMPVTVMGIGAQAPEYGRIELSKGTIRALRILGDHATVVGARGAFTAEVLKELGVANVEPVGCPSFFRAMDRDLTVSFDPGVRGTVAYNMNRRMSGIYGSRTAAISRLQRDLFIKLRRAFNVIVTFCQGEPPEFIAAHRLTGHYADLRRSLVRDGFADDESDPIIDDLIQSAVCATSIRDWERRIEPSDLVIGMRFHGTTVGLANGVPSIYLVNDTRIHELAAHFGVPHVDMRKLSAAPTVDSLLEAADFGVFNAQFADRFDRFANYLIRNGLPSKIQPGSPVERELRYAESALHLEPEAPPRRKRSWLGRARRRVAAMRR